MGDEGLGLAYLAGLEMDVCTSDTTSEGAFDFRVRRGALG
jgi:hypothetical protein